jgi:outer membrane protein TolC
MLLLLLFQIQIFNLKYFYLWGFIVHATLVLSFLITTNLLANAPQIQWKEFYRQALQENTALQAAKLSLSAQELKSREVELITTPLLFGSAMYGEDEHQTMNPSFMGSSSVVKDYALGVKQKTSWGSAWTLSYEAKFSQLNGTVFTNASAYDAGPKLEWTQSLFRNFAGAEVHAQQNALKYQYEGAKEQSRFQAKMTTLELEVLFYRTATMNLMHEAQQEGLDRAVQLHQWTKQRSAKGLSDSSDALQAESMVLSKEIDVDKFQQDYKELYDQLKNSSANGLLSGALLLPSDEEVLATSSENVATYPEREDLVASRYMVQAQNEQALFTREKYKPDLEIFGSLQYLGRDREFSESRKESFDRDYPVWGVGVRFLSPLYLGAVIDVGEGNIQEAKAYHLKLAQQVKSDVTERENLRQKWEREKNRFKLSLKMLKAQEKKLQFEKQRLRLGRTTTFQVLNFEIDFVNAQILYLKSKLDLLVSYATIKTYYPWPKWVEFYSI